MFTTPLLAATMDLMRLEFKRAIAKGEKTQAQLDDLSLKLNISDEDHAAYQTAKSNAQANGQIDYDIAMTIYAALGHSADHFNSQELAVKIVILKIMACILKSQLSA